MYTEIKEKLIRNKIKILKGLTNEEIKIIENLYEIKMPDVYIEFLKSFLVKDYNQIIWNDFSSENINKIKKAIEFANYYNADDLALEWSKYNWPRGLGVMPNSIEKAKKYINNLILEAPKLIPLDYYGYSVIAEGYNEKNLTILHKVGVDIIEYAIGFEDYIMIEVFNNPIDVCKNFNKIKVWSDLL